MAIYHRDEYSSDADWALDVLCEKSSSFQMAKLASFLLQNFPHEESPILSMMCFLDLPNAREKFEQFLIKEAEYHV